MLSQCKEEVLSSVQSAYGGDFQERSEKKKKNPATQPFRSIIVMQGENLVPSSSLSTFAG